MIGIYGVMNQTISVTSSVVSAVQLRREAAKARQLADAAFREEEHRQLIEIAAVLEREAETLEAISTGDSKD